MLLCDYAEVLNGKLYVMGGGWSKVIKNNERPFVNVTIAGMIYFQWNDANHRKNVDISLFTQDGQPVLQNDVPVQLRGPAEVGRPPGLVNGTEIELPIATRFEGLFLDAGRYEWRLSIDDERLATSVFDVMDASAL